MQIKPASKIVDYIQEQGSGRGDSGTYAKVCEHFEEVGSAAIER
jgi:hypothetical protein